MYFKRKAYEKLLTWKEKYADHYGALLEGARRVGKSTIAEQFARNEYKSYILIDFANASDDILDCFSDISRPELFFTRLQAVTGTTLYDGDSVIIFDEIQLFPKARQAIKYLVKYGHYHYIETGSLISIRKNVKGIVIPSEEMKISVCPMDYEEFLWATDMGNYDLCRELLKDGKQLGQSTNRKLMRDFRIYMAVGGMPQAVQAYADHENFARIDAVKREIIRLYEDDFKKIDASGSIAAMYKAIPAQLSRDAKRYIIAKAIGRQTTRKDELLYDLVDSRTVNIAYNTTDPRVSLSNTKDLSSYKLYTADTGLFVTLLFLDRPETENTVYAKLLSDKLPANLGYLYENAVAQLLASCGRELFYHAWREKNSAHYYEVDFLCGNGDKVDPIEVKSSGTGKHRSLTEFCKTYASCLGIPRVVSQKDMAVKEGIRFDPVYLLPAIYEYKS